MESEDYISRDPSGENPIILPIPVVADRGDLTRIVIFTKFLSWLTGVLLATAVIISLVSITSERDNLRGQLDQQTREQECRAAANVVVNRAQADRNIVAAQHDVLVGDFVVLVIEADRTVPEYQISLNAVAEQLKIVDVQLAEAGRRLEAAVTAQEAALKSCST